MINSGWWVGQAKFWFLFITSKYTAAVRNSFIFRKKTKKLGLKLLEAVTSRQRLGYSDRLRYISFMEIRFHFCADTICIILWLLTHSDSEMYPRLFNFFHFKQHLISWLKLLSQMLWGPDIFHNFSCQPPLVKLLKSSEYSRRGRVNTGCTPGCSFCFEHVWPGQSPAHMWTANSQFSGHFPELMSENRQRDTTCSSLCNIPITSF